MEKGTQKKGLLIVGGKLVTENKVIANGFVLTEENRISQLGYRKDLAESLLVEKANRLVIKVPEDSVVLPGFIDPHLHGALGADVMDATSEALSIIAKALPSEGVTSFLATTMTEETEILAKVMRTVASCMEQKFSGAELLGLHLEGPFINSAKAGAQSLTNIQEPNLELFNSWLREAKGKICLVTLAPELKGASGLIKALKAKGIISSVGHSAASFGLMQEAITHGLTHATHLFNGMPALHHREPGVVGAVLLSESVRAEIIFDGVHVAEEMVELAYQLKGSKGLILITDSIRAKGLGDGEYELGGQKVLVNEGVPRLADGTLAGSVLKMNEAVKRAHKLVHGNLSDLVRLSALNAAEELGIDDKKGTLDVGKDADIVVVDKDFQVQLTVCRGQVAYISES